MSLGVAIAAGTAVQLDLLLGGWRPVLATWGASAGVTAALWFVLTPALRRTTNKVPVTGTLDVDRRLPWRSRTAWWVTAYSAVQMTIGFSGLAWITPLYVSLGLSAQEAANRFAVFQVVVVVTLLALAPLTDRVHDRRPLLAVMTLITMAGIAIVLVDPVGLSVVAMCCFGAGIGGGGALGLVLILDVTESQGDAARVGAMVLLVSFICGAIGPVLLGLLRDVTGGFTVGFTVLLALAIALLCSTGAQRPGRTIGHTDGS